MAIKKHHPIRNLLIPIAIAVLGMSAYDYYDDREITWYEDLVTGFNEVFRDLHSRILDDDVAPFVFERSQSSDEIRVSRSATPKRSADKIDSRFKETGEPRFELVGRVARIVDGDSLEVSFAGNKLPVRLHGIDTPEHDQPHGKDATRALARKLERRTVLVNIVDIDSYGRYVGTVYYRGENINLSMVAEGHGWWYKQFASTDQHLEYAEQDARKAGLGLWSDVDPVAPWDWRRAN